MKIDKQKLQSTYLAKINQICENCEDKSHFPIEEIISIISDLLDTGEFYSPPKTSSVLEICATRKKLLPHWGEETRDFVDELYSRLEYAETDLEVLNLRLKKQWTDGSNLYTQKEVNDLENRNYNAGYNDGQYSVVQNYDGHFIR